MISLRFAAAMVAATLVSTVVADKPSSVVSIPTPTASVVRNAMTTMGCYDTGVPLEDHGSYQFQSVGNCQPICLLLNKQVMGLVNGTNCWCGDLLPPKNAQVSNSSCNTPCSGIDTDYCGGADMWWVLLTGLNRNEVKNFVPSSSSSRVSSTQGPDVASTVFVTPTNVPSQAPKKKDGPNKAGIAAGVVVGVVALAAIIGGIVLYLRHLKRREVEEEYRRQAAANGFGGKLHTSNSSMTDSRLDPEFMARRQSNGSIADNEDYSRRILKVTNPDGH